MDTCRHMKSEVTQQGHLYYISDEPQLVFSPQDLFNVHVQAPGGATSVPAWHDVGGGVVIAE